ncbi:lipoate--protein ligase [Tepidanaerobacter syntrophicus]|uniref:lipoate--protein ligase n=1 Tax=Tepidanaerobacter syntrophicus TaxID=224999 RepID=UPI0022EF7BDB|nr:lipoate--protein ligase [Tepidanaerobacter syntrophicus]GLI51805.1 lipoate--protein ligase [Tepidanaerobacter syntrophicus]
MLYIKNESNDPYFNMALDEYVVSSLDPSEDYFYFYQNKPAVIIGRNQNTIEEVNREYVNENNIIVVRRMSGGGAVYHDLGNVNFSFVVDYKPEDFNNIERFAKAIVKALEKLGINAEFSGRNDITIDGKKISGNAQYITKGRILHHGTLLFDSDLTVLSKALNVKPEKILSKGVKSVKSRVTNIKEYLKDDISIPTFKEMLLKYVFEVEGSELNEYILTPEDMKNITKLRNEKYATWEWNFGNAPEFDLVRSHRFDGGEIQVRMNVRDGIITDIKFFGDFMSVRDISEVEKQLKGQKFKNDAIKAALSKLNLKDYFGSISLEEIASLFY